MSTSSPVLSEFDRTTAESLVRGLTERLRQTRERIVRVRWFTGACCIGIAALATFAGLALVDYFAELRFGVRLIGLVSLTAAVAAGIYWVYRQFIAQVTLTRTAAETERQVAEFGQRLRTTLDYSRGEPAPAQASPQLLAAMHRQTMKVAQQVDWKALVDGTPAFIAFVAGLIALVGWIVALALAPEYRKATARMLLLPVEYSQVSFAPHEQTVKHGESVEVSVEIEGRPVPTAIVRFRTAGSSDAWTTIDLADPGEELKAERDETDAPPEPVRLVGGFSAKLADLEQDVEFEVIAGPKPLPPGIIKVLQPLKLEKVSARVTPPKYTRKPEQTVESLDLKVLEGSAVLLKLDLSRAAAEGLLVPIAEKAKGGDAGADAGPVSMSVVDTSLVATLPDLRHGATYAVSAKTADGMALDPLTVRIRVQLDKKPEVKFLAPQEELMVTPTTEIPVVAEAKDDLGLYRVGMMYQISGGTLYTLWEGSGEGSDDPLRAVAQLMLEDHEITFQDGVTYYAFAEDNYFGEPRRTTTELRFIDIRPFKIDYALAGSDDHEGESSQSSVSLEELIKRQRDNLVAGFAADAEQNVSAPVADQLRLGEQDLWTKTAEFNEGMRAKVGPVPALDDAVAAMGEAVELLSKREISDAVGAEQEALGSLMKARENLRQLLKNSNSQSKSEAKKFDRQFKQKLRTPPKEKESAEKKLTEARKKLDSLAERERKWGQQCQSCCNSASSSSSQSQSQSQSQTQSQSPSPSDSQADQGADSQKPEEGQKSEQAGEKSADQQGESKSGDKKSDAESQPTAEELAKAQEQIRKELADLKQQLASVKESGNAAQKQADQTDQSLQDGLDKLNQNDAEGVAQAAENSAQKLEELSEHLAALAARDFGDRLDEAGHQANQIAREQEQLAQELGAPASQSAGDQAGDPPGTKSGDKPGQKSGQQPGEKSGDKAGGKPGDKSDSNSEESSPSGGDRSPADQPGAGAEGSSSKSGEKGRNGPGTASGQKPGKSSRPGEQIARDQQTLATRMEMLAELLDRLRRDASGESADIRRKLEEVAAENPPGEVAAQMAKAAIAAKTGKRSEAGQAAGAARDQADELAKALGAARDAFAQPGLQELLALEEQLAQLMQQAQRAPGAQKGELPQKWNALEEKLDKLAKGDPRLAEALKKLREGPGGEPNAESKPQESSSQLGGKSELKPNSQLRPAEFQQNGEQAVPQGHYSWLELGDFHGPLKVAKALQAKIQEAILAGALQDADQPVPAEYKPLVEKYYKTLSDDLR